MFITRACWAISWACSINLVFVQVGMHWLSVYLLLPNEMQHNEVVNEVTRWHIGRALAAPKHTFSNPILLTQTVTFISCQAKVNQSVSNVIEGQFGWSSACESQPFLQTARRIGYSLHLWHLIWQLYFNAFAFPHKTFVMELIRDASMYLSIIGIGW